MMTATCSHEMLTPLNSILNLTDHIKTIFQMNQIPLNTGNDQNKLVKQIQELLNCEKYLKIVYNSAS